MNIEAINRFTQQVNEDALLQEKLSTQMQTLSDEELNEEELESIAGGGHENRDRVGHHKDFKRHHK